MTRGRVLMRSFIFLLLLIGIPLPSYAQLSPRQKADDFLTIVTLYDRLYAPLALVTQETGFNPLNARSWVERAKVTASDAEFYQLCRRYLARFGNTQDTLNLTPGPLLGATLGFTINYYNNTLLIDSIDRDALPETQYPFQIGDQLLSVDHRSIDQWQNTDGLILDLMRNDGGNANYQDQVAQRFFHTTFKTLAERIRPTQSVVQAAADALATALRANPPDQDLIDHLRQVCDELNSAYTHGQRLTRPLLLRNTTALLGPIRDQAGNVIAYSKPILLLVDENTACGAEAFAAVFQDNQRGPIAGKRTPGVGGALGFRPGPFFSEAFVTFTESLFVREQ